MDVASPELPPNTIITEQHNSIKEPLKVSAPAAAKVEEKRIIQNSPSSGRTQQSQIATVEFSQSSMSPFGGLPAAHLTIQNARKIGFINRIERRLFFDQTKKYYAGTLHGWLLLYNSQHDLKPSICINLMKFTLIQMSAHHQQSLLPDITVTNVTANSPNKKRDFCFQLSITMSDDTIKKKSHQFQAMSEADFDDWINEIEHEKMSHQCAPPRTHLNTSVCRKLPEPPLQSNYSTTFKALDLLTTGPETIHDTSCMHQRKSDTLSTRTEGIYEEPAEMFTAVVDSGGDETSSVTYDNVYRHFDSICSAGSTTITDQNNIHFNYDIPKSPPKCLETNTNCLHAINLDTKFKDVKLKLTEQLQTTNGGNSTTTGTKTTVDNSIVKKPTEIAPKKISIAVITKKSNKSQPKHSHRFTANVANNSNTSHKKGWFFTRLNKTQHGAETSLTVSDAADNVEKSNGSSAIQKGKCTESKWKKSLSVADKGSSSSSIKLSSSPTKMKLTSTAKGGKVNQIINQLEANGGHLPIFLKNEKRFDNDSSNGTAVDDDNNYEPVSILSVI